MMIHVFDVATFWHVECQYLKGKKTKKGDNVKGDNVKGDNVKGDNVKGDNVKVFESIYSLPYNRAH